MQTPTVLSEIGLSRSPRSISRSAGHFSSELQFSNDKITVFVGQHVEAPSPNVLKKEMLAEKGKSILADVSFTVTRQLE